MNLIIQGGALPTFLLEKFVAATRASTVQSCPPQVIRLPETSRTLVFDAPINLFD